MNLTHINEKNNPTMVDVSNKEQTQRVATASGLITMSQAAFDAVLNNTAKKGPVIQTAVIAGIMAAKNTATAIPMCHPIALSGVDIDIAPLESGAGFLATASVKCQGVTGVEMEALNAVSVALLTIYDMLKAIDKSMVISDIKLLQKSGGKSGDFRRE